MTRQELILNIQALESQGARPDEIQEYLNSLGAPVQGPISSPGGIGIQDPSRPSLFDIGAAWESFQSGARDISLLQEQARKTRWNPIDDIKSTVGTAAIGALSIPRALSAGFFGSKQGAFLGQNIAQGMNAIGQYTPEPIKDVIGDLALRTIKGYQSMSPEEKAWQNAKLAVAEGLSYILGIEGTKGAVGAVSSTVRNRLGSAFTRTTTTEGAVQSLVRSFERAFIENSPAMERALARLAERASTQDARMTSTGLLREIIAEGFFPTIKGKLADFSDAFVDLGNKQGIISRQIDDVLGPVDNQLTDIPTLQREVESILVNDPRIDVNLDSALAQTQRFFDSITLKSQKSPGWTPGKLTAKQLNQTRMNMNAKTRAYLKENFAEDVADAVAKAVRKRLDELEPKVRDFNVDMARLQRARKTLGLFHFKPINVGILGNQLGRFAGATALGATGIATGSGSLVIAGIVAHFGGEWFANMLRRRIFSPAAKKTIIDALKNNPALARKLLNQVTGEDKKILLKELIDPEATPEFERLALPEPAIQLGPRGSTRPDESGLTMRNAPLGEPGRTPQGKPGAGRFFRTYRSDFSEGEIPPTSREITNESHLAEAKQYLREAKGLSASDIMAKHPDIQLKRDVPVTDIHGNKKVIPEGEALTPYELKGNKVLLQDGETYIVSKNQYQNVKGQAISGEAKDFAPELKGTEETVKGETTKGKPASYEEWQRAMDEDGIGAGREEYDQYIRDFKKGNALASNPPKYSQYTLPGGKNYKEILVKATKGNTGKITNGEVAQRLFAKNFSELSEAQKNKVVEYMRAEDTNPVKNPFTSSHWDEPNVLFHNRMNERTYKGKKVSFLEEIQSDWAKEGRRKGFADATELPKNWQLIKDRSSDFPGVDYVVIDERYMIKGTGKTAEEARANAFETLRRQAVPSNPLLKNWQTLAVKRALKEAVDSGADYFAWINGAQTSARYDLATYVDDVKWSSPEYSQYKRVEINAKEGKSWDVNVKQDGTIAEGGAVPSDWKGKKLDEVLGKGLADKIMEKESGTLSGEGLKFGGEWAENLYDKQVGNIVKDLTGAKVEKLDMGLPVEAKNSGEYGGWRIAEMTPQYDGMGKPLGYSTPTLWGAPELTTKNLRIGDTVGQNSNNLYIITDILGDGKFKAIPKEKWIEEMNNAIKEEIYTGTPNQYYERGQKIWTIREGNTTLTFRTRADAEARLKFVDFLQTEGQTFDISQKTTTQQGIRLTPEIKAIIKGESPLQKQPSGKSPF